MIDIIDFLKDTFNFLKDNIGIFLPLSTIIGGIIGFIANSTLKVWVETNKMKADKKNLQQKERDLQQQIKVVRQQMVTNNIAPMRQEWIKDLRDKISEFNMLAKMIRINIYRNFGTAQTLDENRFNSVSNSLTNDIYKLNALSSYLDLLLPFNVKGEERKEETAEKLRIAIHHVVDGCERLMDGVHIAIINNDNQKKYPKNNIPNDLDLITIANSILTSIEAVSIEAKMLLLEEWRETKSLKELE